MMQLLHHWSPKCIPGMCEEASEPEQNPHKKNMQTHRKAPVSEEILTFHCFVQLSVFNVYVYIHDTCPNEFLLREKIEI